jgi:hypothetical protein
LIAELIAAWKILAITRYLKEFIDPVNTYNKLIKIIHAAIIYFLFPLLDIDPAYIPPREFGIENPNPINKP